MVTPKVLFIKNFKFSAFIRERVLSKCNKDSKANFGRKKLCGEIYWLPHTYRIPKS